MRVDAGRGVVLSTDSGNKEYALNMGGVTPKVVVMFPAQTDEDEVWPNARWGMGVLTNTQDYFMAVRMEDNVTPSNTYRRHAGNRCIGDCQTSIGGFAWNARGKSTDPLTPDKMTLDIVSAPSIDRSFGYLAIGGDDVDVNVGSFALEGDAQQTITGLDFEPEALILMTIRETGDIEGDQAGSDDARLSIGFSDGTNEYNSALCSDDAQSTTQCHKTIRSDTILCNQNMGTGAVNDGASLNSFTSDGFILDLDPTWDVDTKVVYVALRGVNFKTGTFQSRTAVEEFSITDVGFKGQAMMLLNSGNSTALDTNSVDAVMYGGFAVSPTQQWVSGITDESGLVAPATTLCKTASDDDECMVRYKGNNPTTLHSSIEFVKWLYNGFTLSQTKAEATTGRTHIYLVIGGADDGVNLRGNLKDGLLGGFQ